MLCDTLTIVGVGLIGGSVGLAARRAGLARRVVGVGRNAGVLEAARRLGTIDEGTTDLAAAGPHTDLAVLCTPVDLIANHTLTLAAGCRPGTLLTDAGSTKAAIVAALAGRLPTGVQFVGSHPLAGSEKRGPEHARADLFDGRVVVLTPTADTDPATVERLASFWSGLGATVRRMDPVEHDAALAWTSHLPHLAACAVAGVVPVELLGLTAGGYRDTTRVAGGDPALWSAIFRENRAALARPLDALTGWLARFRSALEAGDGPAIEAMLRQAREVRDALGS